MAELGGLFSEQPMLVLAIAGILAAIWGWRIQESSPRPARLLTNGGYLCMAAAALFTIGLAAYRADKSDAALMIAKAPQISVESGVTRIPVSSDGHFWVDATVNGQPIPFLIDTGATYTSLSGGSAQALGLTPDPQRMPIRLNTANGLATGRFTTIGALQFGSIRADRLNAVIMVEDEGETNVIGMNLLSMLGSWSVANGTMILVPASAQ